ncbi:MAG: asparagine synthase (glutamine-hydrolyzing) [Pseudomonadota bacterium]
MGGLAAIIDFSDRPDVDLGRRLATAVALRGPDQEGEFLEGPAFLAQRRNAVTPGGRRQPLVSERYVLVFDGRLYDHVDLARRVPGDPLGGQRSPGDADVLLQAWEAWGPGCLGRLDGAWAIAVWDRKEQALYLARDPLGQRPLFYAIAGGRLALSSLPDRLALLPWVSREPSVEHLGEYLAFRYVHAPRTLLAGVQSLPPGCLLRFDPGGTRIEVHTHLRWAPAGAAEPSDEEGLRELDRLLQRAVARRGRAGVPVGVLLSGGTDSTCVTLEAAAAGLDVRGFHLHFPESGVEEAAFAGRVARLVGVPLQQVEVGAVQVEEGLERCTRAMGSPLPDPAGIGQYLLLREARREVRVVLSGEGGDELLAGGHLASVALLTRQVSVLRRAAGGLGRRLEQGLAATGLSDLALRPGRYGLSRLAGGTEVLDAQARALLLGPEQARPRLHREALLPLYAGVASDPINTLLAIFQRGWLPEDILARSDRLAAACGIEVRHPLLDLALVNFLNATPGGWKLRTHWGLPRPKWPLRRLLHGRVPRSVYDRPKRSWPSPLNRWLRHEGASFLRRRAERLQEPPWGLWRPEPVRAMVRAHLAGERYHGGALWVLILLEAWLRQLAELR